MNGVGSKGDVAKPDRQGRTVSRVSKKALYRQLDLLGRCVYPLVQKRRDFLIETGNGLSGKTHVVLPPVLRLRKHSEGVAALIVSSSAQEVRSTTQALGSFPGTQGAPVSSVALGTDRSPRQEARDLANAPHLVIGTSERIIDHLRRENLDVTGVRTVVIEEPKEEDAAGFNADVLFILSKVARRPQIAAFTPHLHEETEELVSLLRRPLVRDRETWMSGTGGLRKLIQEEHAVRSKDKPSKKLPDPEALNKRIEEIIRRIHEDEAPEDLDYFRRIIRKKVPFFLRGYFAAYLLKNAGVRAAKSKQSDNYISIFVGVGKNRRVFPRDLIQLFSSVNSVTSEDVGEIKILDNYSFAEITPEKAPQVIEKLNGTEFRGRKLTVNFARRKD